jgi:hypothetical protein
MNEQINMPDGLEEFISTQNLLKNDYANRFNKDIKDFQTLSFASYQNPIFKEKLNKKWVQLGPDNMFCNWLISITNNCPLHQAIITNKIQNIYGEGLAVEDSNDKDMLSKQTEFLKNTQINKMLKRCISDYIMFGYFFIGITWSNDRTKIARLYHVDAAQVRVGVPNKDTREVEVMYYSEDWAQHKKKDFIPEEIPVFDPSRRIEPNCLMMVRNYKSNTRFYGYPDWIGATTAIQLSYETGNYMLGSVMNGLSPSLIFNFNNGVPSQEEQMAMYQSVQGLYSGSKNAGKAIFSFNQSKDNATTVEPIQTANLSEIYSRLSDYCDNSIVRAHQLPNPVLAGIAVPGQLGLSNELSQSSSLYLNNVIYPVQTLMEETIQELLALNGYTLKIHIKDNHPINFTYEDSTLLNIMTVNELRHRISLPPLAKNDVANLGINAKTDSKGGDTIKNETVNKVAAAPKEDGMAAEGLPSNNILTNLTGRQNQSLMRVLKQYSNDKLTRAQAKILLSSGYGLSDEQINEFLPEEEEMELQPNVPKYTNQVPDDKKK